jgi:hypothetical protein
VSVGLKSEKIIWIRRRKRDWATMKLLVATVFVMLAVGGCGGASTSSGPDPSPIPRQVIPLTFSDTVGGVTAQVSVGGGPSVPVLVDTGSTGLRIFEQSVGSDVQAQKDVKITEEYEDSTTYDGYLASASVKIGPVTTSSPIDVNIVDSIGCAQAEGNLTCAGSIKDVIKRGFYGIMGIMAMPNAPGTGVSVYSPLPSISGFEAYTIDVTGCITDSVDCSITSGLPSGNPTSEIQMTKEPDITFDGTPVPSPPAGITFWNPLVNACWAIKGSDPKCVPSIMDSGTFAMVIANGTLPGLPTNDGIVPKGTAALEFYGSSKGGQPLWTMETGGGIDIIDVVPQDANSCSKLDIGEVIGCIPDVIVGIPFWNDFKIAYDLKNGTMSHYKVVRGSTPSASG